jgi:membrane protein DedA with SNARE-associated domain
VPRILVYAGLGGGAALENVVPAVPADTFVLLGGLLSATGDLQARWVFLVTWVANVSSALAMYWVGRTRGRVFFELGWGRHLLNDAQVGRMTRFYARWGVLAVFFTRFLPGLRSVVPVFAGVSHQRFLPVALPIGLASALWYGALVWLGTLAGHNLEGVFGLVANVNHALLAVALVLGGALGLGWWWTRHHG